MPNGLIDSASDHPSDPRIYGVTLGYVTNNIDQSGLSRVQIHLPWLPSVEPWARVAMPMTGKKFGMYFIPQVGDEVLVAFNHGDINEPYVIGSLWNGVDGPPVDAAADAVNKRIIQTPHGHKIVLDETEQAITITSISGHVIKLTPSGIEISTAHDTTKVQLGNEGKITIQANTSIELKAPSISIKGDTLDLQGSASVSLKSSGNCEVQGGLVKIN